MGATPWQIIHKVLLSALVGGLTLSVINLIGYSAMAGLIGGGGPGDLAIRYGYQRFRIDVMFLTVVILIALVHLCQGTGDLLAKRIRHDGKDRTAIPRRSRAMPGAQEKGLRDRSRNPF